VLIFRRTICIFTVTGIVPLCAAIQCTDQARKLSTENAIFTQEDKVKTIVITDSNDYSEKVNSFLSANNFKPLSPLLIGALDGSIDCDDTRHCKYTNCPPEDEHSDARNMLRITM
jgi:hypothetical protein